VGRPNIELRVVLSVNCPSRGAGQGGSYGCSEVQRCRSRSWSQQGSGARSSHRLRFRRRERYPRHCTLEWQAPGIITNGPLIETPESAWPELTIGNILKVSYNVLYRRELSRRNRRCFTPRHVRRDSVKSRDVFVSLWRVVKSSDSSDNNLIPSPVGGRLGERLECAGTILLAVLDAPQACSGRSKGYFQMSVTPLGSTDDR
jgi:hypothetical protein